MKVFFLVILTIGYLNVFSQQKVHVRAKDPNDATHQKLLQEIRNLTEAWGKSDTVVLSKMLAKEYQHSDVFGKIQNRQEWLTFAAAPRKISDLIINDIEVLLYNNNIALITGKMSYLFGDQKAPQEIRFTQVWTINYGKWKRSAFHATLINKTK